MHTVKANWSEQVFALAASYGSGGRKSRIRRPKEERKAMVESFIKKYQKSHNGNFPSLNLTHKEVGGSFYTVREIIREIIQENRILAPPQVSLEEHEHSGFLEQHPLGSISMEPELDLLESNRNHMSIEDGISNSSMEFHKSSPLQLDNRTHGSRCATNPYQSMDEVTNSKEQSRQPNSLDKGKIINGIDVLEENPHSDSDKQHLNETDQVVDKTLEFRQRIFPVERNVAEDVDAWQAAASQLSSDIVVEKFPLRPVPWTVPDMDIRSSEVHNVAAKMEGKSSQHDQMTYVRGSSDFVDSKDEKELQDSIARLNGEFEDKKMVLDLQDPSLECLKDSTVSEPEISLHDGTKVSSSTRISENSIGNLNCSETSEKSTKPEDNPIVALLKEIVSSFVKFWTK